MVESPMTHTVRGKQKLLARVRRIKGQVDAIERTLENEASCEQSLACAARSPG
jgi:DNA-binding FrmR family transcriptional regulator